MEINNEISDEKLLEYYRMGWNDSSNNNEEQNFNDFLLNRAYIIGWLDFIVGDDISSVDLQTDEQIVNNIRNFVKNED